MLKKRIIPCLDIHNGQTVKGVNFVNLIQAGDPVELAKRYEEQGADELVLLDISATNEGRKTFLPLIKRISKELSIPFSVGGGISNADDVYNLLNAGADKVSINSSAIKNPQLISELSKKFGSQCVIVAIDAAIVDGEWKVFIHGGKKETDYKLFEWAKMAEDLGAGEILLTSMLHDGTKAGFAVDIIKKLSETLHIPIIASGGAGNMEHFIEIFKEGKADAALAASIFHFGEIKIPDLKKYLKTNSIPVR